MSARASSAGRGSERYAERRRLRRRRFRIFFSVLSVIVLGAALWGLHQSAVRISHVEIFGADQSLATYATDAMRGSYWGLIPRDSTFFYPADQIRSRIMAGHNDIAALSIFRKGFDGLSIKVDARVAVARWCGLAPTQGVEAYCYIFDSSGYVYAASASSTETINPFTLYAPLVGDTQEALRATIAGAEDLPATFDFAREVTTLGASVKDIVIHDGEVDMHLNSGTRLTYVLGREQDAFTALVSSKDNLNLADGSIIYIDLRFDGKVYLKRKSDTVQ